MFRLPPEIRNLVYSHSLHVGRVYPYHHERWPKNNLPSVALLRTCSHLRDEAEPSLYDNIFVFATAESLGFFLEPFLSHNKGKGAPVQNVELVFQRTNIAHGETQYYVKESMQRKPPDTMADLSYTHTQLRHYHQVEKEVLRKSTWKRLVELVVDNFTPQKLILDLRLCKCCKKCCSMQMSAIGCFESGFAYNVIPKVLELRGFIGFDDKENNLGCQLVLMLLDIWTIKRNDPSNKNLETLHGELGSEWQHNLCLEIFREETALGYPDNGNDLSRAEFTSSFQESKERECNGFKSYLLEEEFARSLSLGPQVADN